MAQPRLLSHSEIETAQTCWARHAFAYTGHLTGGSTLKRRSIPRILSEGRAHGAAVQAWHAGAKTLLGGIEAAEALRLSLATDELEMAERGFVLEPEQRAETEEKMLAILAHYIGTVAALNTLTRIEEQIVVGIPSRTGRRASTRYRFQCFLDGWTEDDDGRPWLAEFKLRGRLTDAAVLQNSRQLRWYAWALRQAKGIDPIGVVVDETLNAAPGEPRIVNAKRKGEGIDGKTVSHAADQLTTSGRYLEACEFYGCEPNLDTVAALDGRRWHQRVPIIFRPGELDEAGEELTSAAKLIRDLDSGELYPIRHSTQPICNSCRFKEICAAPEDELYIETLFEKTVPKRLREPEEAATT